MHANLPNLDRTDSLMVPDVPDVHDLEVKLLSANDNSLSLEIEDNETSALWCPKGWDFGFWETGDFLR